MLEWLHCREETRFVVLKRRIWASPGLASELRYPSAAQRNVLPGDGIHEEGSKRVSACRINATACQSEPNRTPLGTSLQPLHDPQAPPATAQTIPCNNRRDGC